MATTVTLDSVTTADAAPTAAPHRISNKASKNRVTVAFTVAGTGFIRAWLVRFGPTHLKVGGQGMVCGVARCGAARSLARSLGAVSDDVDYPELPSSADGSYAVDVRAATDDGWDV